MVWWMLVAGGVLVALALWDAITTTVSASTRSGPLTSAVNRTVWVIVHRLAPRDDSLLVRTAGPLSVVLAVALWLVTLWAGWTLIFSADPDAVVSSTTGAPADASSRWLFAAYTAYTLGYGNYVPTGTWEIVAAVALIVGFSLATLSITYLVPVVSAVTDRRRQAALLSTAGTTPEEIVANLHDANGFGALDELLDTATGDVLLTGQRHLAYPVLHHFRGRDRRSAFPPSVAAIDEAVTLLTVASTGPQRPNEPFVRMWRRAVDSVLDLVGLEFPDVDVPPPPSPRVLDELGIERVDDAAYQAAMADQEERRRRLHRFVRSSRWQWPADT